MTEYVTVWENHEPTKLHWGVPVVRCKDCKLCVKKGSRLYCDLNAVAFPEVEPDGFCTWGERREA